MNSFICNRTGRRGTNRRDYLSCRLTLAEELTGSFCSRARAGRPRSLDHQQALTLDIFRGHLLVVNGPKRDCFVCCKVREVKKLTRA